ncbi:MAG: hypothetical protein PHD74_06855 [Candidatus Krumholzibacteria bacterium]|nr:hypothetical protein [Candidatus Krumholzibacteria bacterium]
MNRLIATISIVMLTMVSCWQEDDVVEVPVAANCAPSTPRGVYAVNLNGKVKICWVGNYETDLEGYKVYRGTSADGDFFPIGSVLVDDPDQAEYCFEDLDTSNGTHCYYAVSAYDEAGAESDLIIEEVVSGTPRPEGIITLYEASAIPDQSGYDFYPISLEPNAPQDYQDSTTDLWFGVDQGSPMLLAGRSGVEIQDYGYASSFAAVNYAPDDGWSARRSAEAIPEHMYILRLLETDGYHFAKVYMTAANVNFVTFQWAFQTDPGNPDLAPPAPGSGTGETAASAYRENTSAGLILEATLLTNRCNDPPIVERVTWIRDSERGHRNTE